MSDLSKDPVIDAIYGGIKRDIDIALTNECWRAAVILILAGMDAMAYLGISPEQEEVQRKDFIAWAERYIQFPCDEQLTGADLYGARCAMLHAYGVKSSLSRAGDCRLITYMDKSVPEIRYDPKISTQFVMVSIPALRDAFFDGIDRFLVDMFSDKSKAKIAEERFRGFIQQFPLKKED